MWCIDAMPLSRRQVTAGLYDLLHPVLHRNLGLIATLLPDIMFAYWFASFHFVTCVCYAASTARRTENEGLEKLWKARGVTFPVFSLRDWERKCKTSYQVFGILRCYAAQIGSYQPTFRDCLSVPSSGVEQWKTPVRPGRTLDVTSSEQLCSVLCLFLEF